jgi:hypothetical protein
MKNLSRDNHFDIRTGISRIQFSACINWKKVVIIFTHKFGATVFCLLKLSLDLDVLLTFSRDCT